MELVPRELLCQTTVIRKLAVAKTFLHASMLLHCKATLKGINICQYQNHSVFYTFESVEIVSAQAARTHRLHLHIPAILLHFTSEC